MRHAHYVWKINTKTEQSGKLHTKKDQLFTLVARNNSTLTFVSTKMRIMARSDTAWKSATADQVWRSQAHTRRSAFVLCHLL